MKLSVRKDQPFVASNAFSVAESKIFPEWITKAIYADELIVGFIMYTIENENMELYICRFMIDSKYQGKGYGKATLDIIRTIALDNGKVKRIKLSTEKENSNGIRIYKKFGFKDMNIMEDGEEVFVYELKN